MTDNMNFKQDAKLDAIMVHSAMCGLFEPCTIQLGMTPNEAFGRAEWLKKQSEKYIKKVCNLVEKMTP